MTAWTDPTDPFGILSRVPDGIVLPELSLALFDQRNNIVVTLPWVRNMVAASALTGWFDKHLAERKQTLNPDTKAGRPRDITVEAILVAWFMGKFTKQSFSHTETARFLLSTLNDEQRTSLGVPLVQRDPTAAPMTVDQRTRLDKDAVARRICRLSMQMDDLINPSEYNQPRSRIDVAQKKTLRRTDVTPKELASAQARLDWVTLQIASLPIKMMPRWLRRQYKGDCCIDDTPLRLASRKQTDRVAWDITGGLYIRTKPTNDKDAKKTKTKGKGKDKGKVKYKEIIKSFQAHDAALVIACDATEGPKQYFPAIPIGVTLHAAATDPAGNSKRVFDLLATTGIAKRHLGADRLYPWQLPSKFHLPLIEHGWGLVFDYRIDTLGRQGYAPGGPLLIEGQFHCPMTPDAAIEATRDRRNKEIDRATYKARMAVRAAHRMHEKGKPDHNGTIRVGCPATGTSPKVRCPLAEESLKPHVITQPDGSRGDTRLLVELLPTRFKDAAADEAKATAEAQAQEQGADDSKIEAAGQAAAQAARTDGNIPRVCGGTVSVKRETLVKHRQPMIYGSDEHKFTLRAVRNSQEGFHGFAKDDAQEAIGAPGLRRKRGLPAQSLFAAIGLAVAAIRKIVSFLSHMQQDENGQFYVLRKPRPGSEQLALGEGGGYQDQDDDDNWPVDWLEDIPDTT